MIDFKQKFLFFANFFYQYSMNKLAIKNKIRIRFPQITFVPQIVSRYCELFLLIGPWQHYGVGGLGLSRSTPSARCSTIKNFIILFEAVYLNLKAKFILNCAFYLVPGLLVFGSRYLKNFFQNGKLEFWRKFSQRIRFLLKIWRKNQVANKMM